MALEPEITNLLVSMVKKACKASKSFGTCKSGHHSRLKLIQSWNNIPENYTLWSYRLKISNHEILTLSFFTLQICHNGTRNGEVVTYTSKIRVKR